MTELFTDRVFMFFSSYGYGLIELSVSNIVEKVKKMKVNFKVEF